MGTAGISPFPLPGEPVPIPDDPIVGPKPVPMSNAPGSRRYRHPEVLLYIETGKGTNEWEAIEAIDWQNITLSGDGGDTTATLLGALDVSKIEAGGQIGTQHFAHLLDRLHPDYRVRIAQRASYKAELYFQGYPTAPQIHWSGMRQSVSCVCRCEGQERLQTAEDAQVTGRFMRYDPLSTWDPLDPDFKMVETLPAVFNAGGKPNRSASAYPFEIPGGTYRVHLFTEDNAPDAKMWNYAEALRYIALFHILWPHIGVSVSDLMADTDEFVGMDPAPAAHDPFARRMADRVEDLSVAAMNAEEAIAVICDAAGLHYQVALRNMGQEQEIVAEHYVRIYAVLSKPDEDEVPPERLMISPLVRDVPRQAPFSDLSGKTDREIALAGRAVTASLTIDRRGINAPVVIGGPKEYECSLLLRPGWLPHAKLDDLTTAEDQSAAVAYWLDEFEDEWQEGQENRIPRSVYHGAHPNHHTVSDVGRLWIFPDDHRYVGEDGASSPYSREGWPWGLYDPIDPDDPHRTALVLTRTDIGAGIAGATKWVPRRRPLRETIGRMLASGDRSPVVELNYVAPAIDDSGGIDATALMTDANWVRYAGQLLIAPDRAAVYILEDNLLLAPPLLTDPQYRYSLSMLQAYIEGHFAVRVTCVIRGDERLTQWPRPAGASFARSRFRAIDTGLERFGYRNRRDQNSMMDSHPADPEPEYESRDDTETLSNFAKRTADRVVGDSISGSLETFWLDRTWRLGDSFSGVAGLGVEFNHYPAIIRKEYVKDAATSYRTIVHLTDLRDAPDVGAE